MTEADRDWAEWIAWHLAEAGYKAMVQAWDFRAGGNFVGDMQKAAKEAKRNIAVLSPDYLSLPLRNPNGRRHSRAIQLFARFQIKFDG